MPNIKFTVPERIEMVRQHERGITYRRIAENFGKQHPGRPIPAIQTVRNVVMKFQASGIIDPSSVKLSYPTMQITAETKASVLRILEEDRSKPASKVAKEVGISKSSVRRIIRERLSQKIDCGQSTSNFEVRKTSGATINDIDEEAVESNMHLDNRKRRYNRRYFTEWNLDELEFTPKVRRVLELVREEIVSQRHEIRTLQTQKSRMIKKIKTLKGLLEHTTKLNSISKETSNLFETCVHVKSENENNCA